MGKLSAPLQLLTHAACLGAVLLMLSAPVGAQQEVQQPKDKWQQPKEFQKPRDTWQKPGEIQVPRGIQAIRKEEERCTRRFLVGADALFDFDQATLTPAAEETLDALVPLLAEAGKYPATVEGHTDSKGAEDYNQALSERRAQAVKAWLVAHGALPAATATQGWGERRPVAPNIRPDGTDDPAGRQKNRRVVVVLDVCKAAAEAQRPALRPCRSACRARVGRAFPRLPLAPRASARRDALPGHWASSSAPEHAAHSLRRLLSG